MINLSVSGACAPPRPCKARFGLSKGMKWERFVQGVRDRLQLGSVRLRIESSAGLPIVSVEDLEHRDSVRVHLLAELAAGSAAGAETGAPSVAANATQAQNGVGGEDSVGVARPVVAPAAEEAAAVATAAAPVAPERMESRAGRLVEAWSVDDVASFFIEDIKLTQYVSAIREHDVSGAMLLEVEKDAEALAELGVASKLHISKIRSSLKTAARAMPS